MQNSYTAPGSSLLKAALSLLIFLMYFTASAQETVEQVNKLIEERKYNSAFKLLEEKDTDNSKTELAIMKVNVALDYFVKSFNHQMFAFKDLGADDDLIELRMDGNDQSFSMYVLEIDKILDSLLHIHPKNGKLHQSLGKYYYELHLKYGSSGTLSGQEVLDQMNEHSELAVKMGTSDYMSYYHLGYYQTLSEKYKEAVPHFQKSVELNPSYPTSHYNLAVCYLYSDKPKDGIEHSLKAIDLYEDITLKADAARVASVLYEETADIESSLKYCRLSNKIQADNYYTLKDLLSLELRNATAEEANETAKNFFNLGPKNPTICSDLVRMYSEAEDGESLIKLFNSKIEEYKKDEEVLGNIYFHLGQYYFAQEETKKAKTHFRIAKGHFEKVFEKDHGVFEVLNSILEE